MSGRVSISFMLAAVLAAGCGGGSETTPSSTASAGSTASTSAVAPTSTSTATDCPAVTEGGDPEFGVLGAAVAVFDTATGAFAWEVEVGPAASVAGIGDLVVIGDDTAVRAFDAGDGSMRWCATPGGVVAATDEATVALAPDGTLSGLDPSNGEQRWSMPTAAMPAGMPLISDSTLLGGRANVYLDTSVVTPPGSVMAVDAATGATRWVWEPSGCDPSQAGQLIQPGQPVNVCVGGPWVPVEGPLLYLADTNAARIVALDPSTGDERWATPTDGQAGSVSAGDDIVAFTSAPLPTAPAGGEFTPTTGQLVAVEATSGAERWAVPFDPTGLDAVATGDLVVTLTQTGLPSAPPTGPLPEITTRVDALATATGAVMWTHELPGETPFTVTRVSDLLLMESAGASNGPGFLALDPATGEERWRTEHRSTAEPTAAHSTSGYLAPVAVAGGTRFASLITFGRPSD
jgi:outer membrane protein assembly factor BamB